MHVVHIPAVDQNGLAPDGTKAQLPSEPEFLPQVFKSEVGDERRPVRRFRRAPVRTEGERRHAAEAQIARQRARGSDGRVDRQERTRRLGDKAKSLAVQATAVHSLTAIAASLHVPVQSSGPLARETPTARFPLALIDDIFSTPAPRRRLRTRHCRRHLCCRARHGRLSPARADRRSRYQQIRFPAERGIANQCRVFARPGGAQEGNGVTINQKQVDQVIGGGS
jgi:hypothetical protein